MWMGIAKAIEEDSRERFQAREQQKERDFRRKETLEERQFRLDLFEKEAATRQAELMSQLRIARAAAGIGGDQDIGYVTAVADLVQGVEGSEQFIETLKRNPGAAKGVLDTITERQESLGRPISPSEIVTGIKVAVTDQGTSVVDTIPDDGTYTEYERQAIELERAKNRKGPVVYTTPSLYDNPDKADIELAEQAFTVRLIDLATEELKSMGDVAESSDLLSAVTEARKGDEFAMQELRERFGTQVAGEFIQLSESRPELRPIQRSPVYGEYIRKFMEQGETEPVEAPEAVDYTSTDQYQSDLAEVKRLYKEGALTDEQIRQLRIKYPGEFD